MREGPDGGNSMSVRDEYIATIKRAFARTTYGNWLESEGVKIHEDFAVPDVRNVELAPWPRLGGNAAFLNLYPLMEAARGAYVAEIPAGQALEPERHLYEKVIFVLEGQGATEVWHEGDSGKHVFEWSKGAVFAPPLNVWHRMFNLGETPVRFLAITTAPQMMNGFRDADFIFNCSHAFRNRFNGEENYFSPSQKRYMPSTSRSSYMSWETNFIHDAFAAHLDPAGKAYGGQLTMFEMSGNSLIGHMSEWPVGRYHKAHYHEAGALLMGLRSEGYVLIWPRELGVHPYTNGSSDDVIEIPWGVASLYAPPGNWFHQHFNTGGEPARHIALRYGSRLAGPGFGMVGRQRSDAGWHPLHTSIDKGGTLIEYEDEDPEIRNRYRAHLARNGIAFEMPDAIYQPGAAERGLVPQDSEE
jgi:mannose-6-phosphate isomerase-like protein (cupin superfamily)